MDVDLETTQARLADLLIQQANPPNACHISSASVRSKDITRDFRQAASQLPTGQLIKDGHFTLFEAVGALEIMDPKMDSGYLAGGEKLDDDYDVLRKLLPEETLGIMDQLLCHEMAWHMGNPLSQTLFTSLYIDRLLWPEPTTIGQASFTGIEDGIEESMEQDLLNRVLRSYCLALIKTCDMVHEKISRETYYEEEDFASNLYNRNLLTSHPVFLFEQILESSIEWIGRQKGSISEDLMNAIADRLKFRRAFLNAVALDRDVAQQREQNSSWEQCVNLIPKLLGSNDLGIKVEEAFSVKIQRRLASTVPPRPIFSISFSDAIEHMRRLCEDGREVGSVFECQGGTNILTFALTFQSKDPQPSVYIRCLLQSFIFGDMRILGNMSFKQLIYGDLAEMVLPADTLVDATHSNIEVPQDHRFQIAKRMDAFVARVGQSYLDVSIALSMNRSRMRRMLCHTIVEWDNVQLDAEEYDAELRFYTGEEPMVAGSQEIWSFPLSSWAYYQKLRQMEWIVKMGFELHIYQPAELAGMYWYLQLLAHTRLQHLQRIRGFTVRRQKRLSNPDEHQKEAFSRSFSFLNFAMLEASAIHSFSQALSSLYTTLSHLSLLPTHPSPPYSTPSLRHSLRMRPFLPISLPTVPSYSEITSFTSPFSDDPSAFDASMTESERLDFLLSSADEALKVARKEWEEVSKSSAETARCLGCEKAWRNRVKNVVRSVIASSITVSTVRKGGIGGQALKAEVPEKGYHEWWVVPKVSMVK